MMAQAASEDLYIGTLLDTHWESGRKDLSIRSKFLSILKFYYMNLRCVKKKRKLSR